ncbi:MULTISPECIES: GNAT family N-acetyltransferase [unclassified Pseudomonas]|uniref:GNAT family N-acetyltransferase n=1 Tax=unclassified Pseudomonas TaxID=196821 RepID=UPI002096FB66|nr:MULTISPECIES: GNAT family N-acetyltransferase [unclassified Pseudomonas]MCO7519051.1 GNAT family N-acetyltransferase [Pseudomonas sp. 1]MCO7539924.1 GNAT family N-acetyltransferase [Pseudomonas sp. VA159-2]
MQPSCEFTDDATGEHYDAILKPLRAYNDSVIGNPRAQAFAWSLRDADSAVVTGGLYGRLGASWMFIELLVVPEACRGQGVGRELMARAEALARDRGCSGIWLDTFSFQAPDFYRRLGFEVFGELADYPPGHTRYFLRKLLERSA